MAESIIEMDKTRIGAEIYALMERLYPICRSITGPGVRETLTLLSAVHPIKQTEIPTGTPVFDWEIPKEWSIRDAYIKVGGTRIVDFKSHNLHVLNYSAPFSGTMSLAELEPHLHSLPDQPDLIPYRTSYYAERWGFCLPHRQRQALDPNATYDVLVDSTLEDGALTLGEIYLPGASTDEILISTHTCHPSLCNDNLSGLGIAVHLAAAIAARSRRLSYRFVFVPGTIGSLAWLAANEATVSRIKAGLVITGLGDEAPFTYKKSRRGDALIDRAAAHVLKTDGTPHKVIDYYPYGYDERQYCSPGFNLGVGRLSRNVHGTFPQYHTSADNLSFVKPAALTQAYETIAAILNVAEHERSVLSLNPKGEPRLGKRGLYRQVAGQANAPTDEYALLWVLAYADGAHSLLTIAEKADMPFTRIKAAAERLQAVDLVRDCAT